METEKSYGESLNHWITEFGNKSMINSNVIRDPFYITVVFVHNCKRNPIKRWYVGSHKHK